MAEILQGSDEWKQLRCGKVTASRIADVLAKRKDGKPSAMRGNYLAELVAERMTGKPSAHFQSKEMLRGNEMEPQARAAYEFFADVDVELVALVDHPTIPMAAASPDGLVGEGGLVEFKNPNTSTHIETLLGAPVDRDYLLQMQWQLACTGRQWVDFVSYDESMPEHLRLFVKRFERDDVLIAEVEKEVSAFLSELRAKEEKLIRLYSPYKPVDDGTSLAMAG